ncbi:NAD(P)-dependent oxidoreductase [Rhodobacteraceae bacterium KMM 6894]|nr:NAD(P)-dependent oxidoreductase [Rhodobacteraceae bacterium KMM 6894]
MKTAIVTGATGFIGARLTRALIHRGVAITAVTRRTAGGIPGVAKIARVGETCLATLVRETNPDVVFHLAGLSGEAAARRDPVAAMEANAQGVWTLLDAVNQSGVRPAVVVASSVAVYGDNDGRPSHEDDRLRGAGPYELSKIAGECAARAFVGLGVDARIARIGNVFGPGDPNVTRLIPETLNAVRENRAPVLRAPDSMRSYLYVDDCISGLIALGGARGAALAGRPVNICAEAGISNIDLVRLILAQAGRSDLHPVVTPDGSSPSIRLASAELAHQALGWQLDITLSQGLEDLLERQAA